MSSPIPLIRSAVLCPLVRWLRDTGRPAEALLGAADLDYFDPDRPERPIPLQSMFVFFRLLNRSEAPDIMAQAIRPSCLDDLGEFGRLLAACATPRQAFLRVGAVLPRYSSHELLMAEPLPGGLRIRAGWSVILDPLTAHLAQQYTASLIRAYLTPTGATLPEGCQFHMLPHPETGLAHLQSQFGDGLQATDEMLLTVDLPAAVVDARRPGAGPDRTVAPAGDWQVLRGDGSFRHSAALLLDTLSADSPVPLAVLARAAGLSPRSVQRALTTEGTTFRGLCDDLRRSRALDALQDGGEPMAMISADLGYASQSSFSRAVRRWTGEPPSGVVECQRKPQQ